MNYFFREKLQRGDSVSKRTFLVFVLTNGVEYRKRIENLKYHEFTFKTNVRIFFLFIYLKKIRVRDFKKQFR